MNIQRFQAATAREALTLARQTFGDGTLILSNRPTAHGVEVVATAEDTLARLNPRAGHAATAARDGSSVQQDTEDLSMSTLSFQAYVRERMLRRRQEELNKPPGRAVASGQGGTQPRVMHADLINKVVSPAQAGAASTPQGQDMLPTAPPATATSEVSPAIMHELQSMKDLIEERFNTLSWLGQARQDPIQSQLMLKLIRSGFSPSLARTLLERLPKGVDAAHALRWTMDVLERNLKSDVGQATLVDEGGMFALVGATGVGKTTTAAKLAALCVRAHGASSVGLITLDTYRVAALEQLHSYARSLGVVAHLAHDRAALQDLLNLLAGKKLILIDTAGLAPRDPRMHDMIDVALDLPRVKRLLVLNAASHGDTLEDVLQAFKTPAPQQVVLSKVDETVKLGPSLDALIRHQAVLRGVTNGQRVPEDWERADPAKLVAQSMQSSGRSAYDPKPEDLNFFFTPAAGAAQYSGSQTNTIA